MTRASGVGEIKKKKSTVARASLGLWVWFVY